MTKKSISVAGSPVSMAEAVGIQWLPVPFSGGKVLRFGNFYVKVASTGYLVDRPDRALPFLCANSSMLIEYLDGLGLPTSLRPVRHVG